MYVLQNNFHTDYTIPFNSASQKNNKSQKVKKHRGVGNTSVAPAPLPAPYLTPRQNSNDITDHSKDDYEPIPNPSDYAPALRVYSNSLTRTVIYDNAKVVQYSKILHQNPAAADDEEIYSDPGHSERDIYDYFKKKKFHIIKKDNVRFV